MYIRHLAHSDHTEYDLKQEQYEEYALAKGGQREATRLAALKASGQWTDANESAIARQRDAITRFEDTIRNTPQPSVVESLSKQADGERAKLAKMLADRAEILGMTVEAYAQRQLNDHYIATNLFADSRLTIPFLPSSSFDDMADGAVEALLGAYHAAIDGCSEANMRALAVQDYFSSYWALCGDDASSFWGRPVCELTYYQVRLASVARYFKSILDHVDLSRVAPETRGNPDAIERLFTAQRMIEQQKAEGKLPGGMSASDIEATGLKGQYTEVKQEESAMDMAKRLMRNHRSA